MSPSNTSSSNDGLVPEFVELRGGLRVPTGNMIAAMEPEPTPDSEPTPAPDPIKNEDPQPEPATNPLEGVDIEFVRAIASDPAKAYEVLKEINTDYDNMPAEDLYKMGWIKANGYEGADQKALEKAFEEHLRYDLEGFDPSKPDLGLEPRQQLAFQRTVVSMRSEAKQHQAQVQANFEALKGQQRQDATQSQQQSADELAKEAEIYQKQIAGLKLSYQGLPQEFAATLDPNLPQQFQAKIVGDLSGKPLFGLERFIEKDGTFNLQAIAQSTFLEQNLPTVVEKAIEYGRSQGRAEMAKEFDGKLNPAPVNQGASTGAGDFITLKNGSKIPSTFNS